MNETYIQQILDIEKQAQSINEDAHQEAQRLSVQAEQEARALIEKTKADSEAEARKMVENAMPQDEIAQIMAQTEENIQHTKDLASSNFDKAVAYVLDQVTGMQ